MAASPPLTLMSAQVNQKCRRKWPPSLHSSTWHWLQRLEDVIWFYILFFKSKKRQPSMLSWNDRPIPFTGKDDLEKCVAENECSFWVCHSFVILRHHLCILYIYIYIDFFIFLRCCWPKEENLLVEFDELTSMEYAASCPSIPFQRVLSSQILNCFFLTPWKMPRLPTKTFFFMSQYWNDFETHLEIPMVQSTLTSGVLH